MTTLTSSTNTQASKAIGDSFALGMLLMLAVNILQRCIGLFRNLGFCQFLSDTELGHWAMANSFFIFAAPMVVCGLPGSFGKFSEYFRCRDSLGDYIYRIGICCLVGLATSSVLFFLFPSSLSWFIYGESTAWNLVGWTILAFITQVLYNFAFDLAVSLRRVRIVSSMQFLQSVSFMVLGIAVIGATRNWVWLLPAYALACLAGAGLGFYGVWKDHSHELIPNGNLGWRLMSQRVVPFALALWGANFLTNCFELCDRYMLLHFSEGGHEVGQALVGQFYCGRIIPNLLGSVAIMVSGILLPYFSADWEQQAIESIRHRMRLILSMVSLGFTGIALVGLLAAPLLFDVVLAGRYPEAQAIMPMSMVQCTWSGLAMIAGSYLLCAEKGRQGSYILAIGVAANIVLNLFLIRSYGIHGAMFSTMIATSLVVLLNCWRVHREGCTLTLQTILLVLLPGILLAGSIPTMLVLTALVIVAGRTDWLLSSAERKTLDETVLPKLQRMGWRGQSLWPS